MVRLCVACSYFFRSDRLKVEIHTKKRRWVLALLCFLLMVYLLTFSSQGRHDVPPVQKVKICHRNVTHDIFVPMANSKTFLLNAYFEHRTLRPSVRVIAIAWRAEKFTFNCVFCCKGFRAVSPAKLKVHNSHFWFRYGTGDFLCEIPEECDPTHVTVNRVEESTENISFLPIHNRKPKQSNFPVNFTICFSTMFKKFNNVLQFVQAMEMYQILGAQRVVIYKNNCSQDMEEVLRYYIGIGLVEVIPWPIDKYIKVSSSWLASESPGDLHYYGQIPALNDCVYKNMYRSKYLFMHDPDEIILPLRNVTWTEFMDTLEAKYSSNVSFYFENNVFPIEEFEESGRYNLSEWARIPGENFLQHVLREPIPQRHYTTGKLIVNPRKVFEISVHTVERQSHRTVEVPYGFGRLYHIRRRKNTKLKRKDLVMDKALWRYAPEMIKAVSEALSKMDLPSLRQRIS